MRTINKNIMCYIVMTLGFTWLLQFTPILMGWEVEGASSTTTGISSLFYTLGGVMPTFLAVMMVLLKYSRQQKISYFKRAIRVSKNGLMWILLVLVFTILQVMIAQGLARILFDAEPFGYTGFEAVARSPHILFVYLFFGLITNGPFNEEFGWRGYLLDQLLVRRSIITASLIVGIVWGIWHLPLYFYPLQGPYQMWQLSSLLGWGFILECITGAFVYTVVYIMSDRSILVSLFVHLFFNIVKTGVFIHPWSDSYTVILNPVTIVCNILFFLFMIRTKRFKLKSAKILSQIRADTISPLSTESRNPS